MKTLRFEPRQDISVYELALVVRAVMAGMNHDIDSPLFKFPDADTLARFSEKYGDIMHHFATGEE